MKNPQWMPEMQGTLQVSQETQNDQQNNPANEAPIAASVSNQDRRKVTCEDIELVQKMIELCLLLYTNQADVVKTLMNPAKIEPEFTSLVWQKLEEENSEFFRAYYIRLKLKKQIILFNQLVEHQYHLMKYPKPPKVPLGLAQNGMHPMPVNNLQTDYPVLQQPSTPAPSRPHLVSVGSGLSGCPVANGVPAACNFHPIQVNSRKATLVGSSASNLASAMPPGSAMSSMSDMAVSPASASSCHFPFTPEMSRMGVNTSALDKAFTSDVVRTRDSIRSLVPIPWNFSVSDIDLTNIGDLGALGDYSDSPLLPSESDILLDSQELDDIVEDYFADSVPALPIK